MSNYQDNQKLFVIASVLDYNPPVTKMPVAKTKSQDQIKKFDDKYKAILLVGHTYEFV